MGIKWKKSEKELLRNLIWQGVEIFDIAIPGRNPERVRRQALKMGLIRRRRNPPLTREEKTKLRQLRERGFSAEQIFLGKFLGMSRTVVAIQKACTKLGLVHKKRSLAAKRRKIWRTGEKKRFFVFLRQNSSKLAPLQIARKFGVKKVTVTNWQRKLGVKTTLQQTLALPFVAEKFRKVYQKRSGDILAGFEKYILERLKKLEALAKEMRQKEWFDPSEEKQCVECAHVWPKHSKFFFHATRRVKGMTSWYFCSRCKICVSKMRHKKNALRRAKK